MTPLGIGSVVLRASFYTVTQTSEWMGRLLNERWSLGIHQSIKKWKLLWHRKFALEQKVSSKCPVFLSWKVKLIKVNITNRAIVSPEKQSTFFFFFLMYIISLSMYFLRLSKVTDESLLDIWFGFAQKRVVIMSLRGAIFDFYFFKVSNCQSLLFHFYFS